MLPIRARRTVPNHPNCSRAVRMGAGARAVFLSARVPIWSEIGFCGRPREVPAVRATTWSAVSAPLEGGLCGASLLCRRAAREPNRGGSGQVMMRVASSHALTELTVVGHAAGGDERACQAGRPPVEQDR